MIKLIAVDMDGTWLRDDKSYDHALFLKEYKIMQEQGVVFVPASGNQYANLQTRFPEVIDQIYYVADNGALIAKGNEVLHVEELPAALTAQLKKLTFESEYPSVASCENSAYTLTRSGKAYFDEQHKYFEKVKMVDSWDDINDRFIKFTLSVNPQLQSEMLPVLSKQYPDVGFMRGGSDAIDMGQPGLNKASGLAYLGQKLGIKPEEMVAFGDGGNDIGMFEYCGLSFATADALDEAKEAATEVIGSSNDSAVQNKILELLANNK